MTPINECNDTVTSTDPLEAKHSQNVKAETVNKKSDPRRSFVARPPDYSTKPPNGASAKTQTDCLLPYGRKKPRFRGVLSLIYGSKLLMIIS